MIQRKRLGQEIDRAASSSPRRRFSTVPKADITITGVCAFWALQLFQQCQAVHAGELQVGEDQIDVAGQLQPSSAVPAAFTS